MRKKWLWIYWPSALVFTALILFAVPEYIALNSDSQGPTFSMFMYTMSVKWPLWVLFWGMLIGGLSVHFLWHWSPQDDARIAELERENLALRQTVDMLMGRTAHMGVGRRDDDNKD